MSDGLSDYSALVALGFSPKEIDALPADGLADLMAWLSNRKD